MSAKKKKHINLSDLNGEHVTSPGEMISRELRKQHLTQKEFAVLMGRSEKFISQLITGKVRLTYDVAFDLEHVLKVPAAKWNAAEATYQDILTHRKRLEQLSTAETIEWASGFPYETMAEKGLVPQTDDSAERALNLLNYFGVATVDAYSVCLDREKGLYEFKKLRKLVEDLEA